MYVYLIVVAISLGFARLACNARPYPMLRGTYRLLAVCSFLPFAVNSMFRGQVGTDWPIYDSYYYYINHGIRQFSEPLFNLLNRVLYVVTPDSALVFATVGFLTLLFFFLGIYQQSDMVVFSILLFFLTNKYFTSLNQIRQMLAMSLFVFAVKYAVERRIWAYMGLIGIAALIHTSSLIYFPVYFLAGKKYSSAGILKGFLLYCISLPIVRIFVPLLVRFTRFAWYFDSLYNQNNFYLIGFAVALIIFPVHLCCLCRLEQRQGIPKKGEKEKAGFFTAMSMLPCMTLLLSAVLPQVLRIAEGFAVVQIFSLPFFIKREENPKWRRGIMILVAGVYASKLLYDVYRNQWYGVLPYHTVFLNIDRGV